MANFVKKTFIFFFTFLLRIVCFEQGCPTQSQSVCIWTFIFGSFSENWLLIGHPWMTSRSKGSMILWHWYRRIINKKNENGIGFFKYYSNLHDVIYGGPLRTICQCELDSVQIIDRTICFTYNYALVTGEV